MDEVALARHGESETSAYGLVGGDTRLTPEGGRQAQALGERLRNLPIGVCLTSNARRARETAELALAGRAVLVEVVSDLGDVRFGDFDGLPLAEYRGWIVSHPPDAAPSHGESRVDTLRRFTRAFRSILDRSERCVLVVAHGLTLRSLLDPRPQPVVAGAPYGDFVRLERAAFERAVERLERWCKAPAW